jgi:hypothetical protein
MDILEMERVPEVEVRHESTEIMLVGGFAMLTFDHRSRREEMTTMCSYLIHERVAAPYE